MVTQQGGLQVNRYQGFTWSFLVHVVINSDRELAVMESPCRRCIKVKERGPAYDGRFTSIVRRQEEGWGGTCIWLDALRNLTPSSTCDGKLGDGKSNNNIPCGRRYCMFAKLQETFIRPNAPTTAIISPT